MSVGAQIPRWGPHAEAPGMLALWQRQGAGEIDYTAADHGLVIALSPIARRQTRLGDQAGAMHRAPAGAINIIPAGADHWGYWGETKESLYFALTSERLRSTAAAQFDDDRVELIACNRPRTDPTLLQLSAMLRAELRGGGLMTELYVDSLGSLILVHLLRRYSTRAAAPIAPPKRGGLSPAARRAVLDIMADRCGERLSVADLAAVARLAPSTFLRAFREEMGEPPHKHLLRLRVARAERLLRESDLPIAAVALSAGFSSQSHLTTILGRLTGRTPASLRAGSRG